MGRLFAAVSRRPDEPTRRPLVSKTTLAVPPKSGHQKALGAPFAFKLAHCHNNIALSIHRIIARSNNYQSARFYGQPPSALVGRFCDLADATRTSRPRRGGNESDKQEALAGNSNFRAGLF